MCGQKRINRPDWDKEEWVGLNYEKLAQQLKDQLRTRWAELYCDTSPKDAPDREHVFQCFRGQGFQSPKFVNDWFVGNLGVTLAEAENLLQVSKLTAWR